MGTAWITLSLILTCCHLVESRDCIYITGDGRERTVYCSAYEYCCRSGCCRATVFKFYQFWYFWLSVILIMLLCSGGSWWYRYKYRTQLLSQHTPFTHIATANISQQRPNTGVLYCPGADRVYLGSAPKDPALYQYMKVSMPPSASYGMAAPAGNFSYPTPYPTPGVQAPNLATPTMLPPPPYGGPPPSYESIIPSASSATAVPPTPYPLPHSSGQQSSQTYPQAYPNPQPTNPFVHGQDAYLRNRSNDPSLQ